MTFPWLSATKYSSVALTACGSGVGACCLITHREPEKVTHVKLSRVTKLELEKEVKEKMYKKTNTCVGKEKKRLFDNRWSNHWSRSNEKDVTPKYDECLKDIPLEGVFQKLFKQDSE